MCPADFQQPSIAFFFSKSSLLASPKSVDQDQSLTFLLRFCCKMEGSSCWRRRRPRRAPPRCGRGLKLRGGGRACNDHQRPQLLLAGARTLLGGGWHRRRRPHLVWGFFSSLFRRRSAWHIEDGEVPGGLRRGAEGGESRTVSKRPLLGGLCRRVGYTFRGASSPRRRFGGGASYISASAPAASSRRRLRLSAVRSRSPEPP
jgi:hypothetical protein